MRVLSLVSLVLLCVVTKLYGQPHRVARSVIDSLYETYLSESNDTLRLSSLARLGQRYRYVNVDTAKYYLRKALAEYKKHDINNGNHAFAYNVIADIYIKESNRDSARFFYEDAYSAFYSLEDKSPLLAISPTYGQFLVSNDETEKGIKIFEEAIAIAEKNEDYKNLAYQYNYMGNVFYDIDRDNSKAIHFYKKGIRYSEQIANESSLKRARAYLNLNLSNVYLSENLIDSAITYATRAASYGNQSNLYHKVVLAYNNLCNIYIKLNDFGKAAHYNRLAQELNNDGHDIAAVVETKLSAQTLKLKTEDFASCIAYGKDLLHSYAAMMTPENHAQVFSNLCDCYSRSGQRKESEEAKDSLLHYLMHSSEEHQESLAIWYESHLLRVQNAENELLRIKQESSAKEEASQFLINKILFGLLFITLAYAAGLYWFYLGKKDYNKRLEETVGIRTRELKTLNEELRQTNYELRTLTHIASHDIKEPIRNISNFASLIQARLKKNGMNELDDKFLIIKNSSKQLYSLIEDFTHYISFSKNEQLPMEEIDLNEVIEDIRSNFFVLGNKSGEIINEGLPTILSNYSTMLTILKNLIENGLKYNESKTPTVIISSEETDGEKHISIKDNGIGIDGVFHEYIFELSKRLHTKSQYDGSGIGLSLVKLLADRLGIKINLHSKLGQGSTFTLVLPSE